MNWKIPEETVEESALADSSRKTYQYVLNVYEKVMQRLKREPYPLSYENMGLFIELERENDKSFSYVNMAIESFVFWFREHRSQDLTKTEAFRAYKKGLRRIMHADQLPNAKDAVTKEMLTSWISMHDPYEDEKHADVCFAFVMMFFGFLRHAEFRALRWGDVRRTVDGLRVFIRGSKTDQEMHGCEFLLPKRRDKLDPADWFGIYQIYHSGEDDEVLWRHSPDWLQQEVKKYAAWLHLPGERFGCHSFRKGGAHAAFAAGVPDCAIKVHGRWRSEAYQRYTSVSAMEAALRVVNEI